MNQQIIGNTEMVSTVLDIIAQGSQLAAVMSASFSFLRAMAVQNAPVQSRLFEDLDILLNSKAQESGWENEMAWLVAEIFNNHQDNSIGLKKTQVILVQYCDTHPVSRAF